MVVDRDSVLVHHRLTEAMETWFTGDGRAGDSGGRDLAAEGSGSEEGRLVHHCGCCYADG
jgi:hypothetical protein